MQSACDVLAQGGKMVLIDMYEYRGSQINSCPKYDDLGENDVVPVSMWTESICQNGEILLRTIDPDIKTAFLTNISGISYMNFRKKETREIVFLAEKLLQTGQYFRTKITVFRGKTELFTCNCTHFIN